MGGTLFFDRGTYEEVLMNWINKYDATAVYWNRNYDPIKYHKDRRLAELLHEQGIIVKTFEGTLLLEPWRIKKEDGSPYKVFTPYYKAHRKESVPPPIPRIKEISVFRSSEILGLYLDELGLLPKIQWTSRLEEKWLAGEYEGFRKLQAFVKNHLKSYTHNRDYPSIDAHSSLSPYLAVGSLSIRSVYHFVIQQAESVAEPFIRQLIWRDFSYSVLLHFPESIQNPLQAKFTKFQWLENQDTFSAWTKGLTGYPIVDAGMRELWETGFMHNRVRMIVASFLTKHLLLSWQKGAYWFWDTLIDADIANNTMGWQWVAGTGLDSAPYFRIFNPTLQGEKFDSNGEYIKKWVPELQMLPNQYIHEPDKAPKEVLLQAGIILGENYPYPIVDHKASRIRALERYQQIK